VALEKPVLAFLLINLLGRIAFYRGSDRVDLECLPLDPRLFLMLFHLKSEDFSAGVESSSE